VTRARRGTCPLLAGGVELPCATALDNGRRSPRKLLRAVVARLFVKPPTDFELLDAIYKRHRSDFEGQSEVPFGFFSKIMIPIDISAIAQELGVEANSVFGRLYYHLDPKYGSQPLRASRGKLSLLRLPGMPRTA
jgi:hypothetical protein